MLLPIINPVVETMEKTGRYQFIWDLRRRLAKLGTEYHDFFDPRDFGGLACEFKDAHHGGNALYAKMLKTAIDRSNSSSPERLCGLPGGFGCRKTVFRSRRRDDRS